MTIWLIAVLTLSGSLVALTFAVLLFPHSRVMNWLTRPIRARFFMRWSGFDYQQAYAVLRRQDTRDRCR